jgi:HAD superfamily hydrolase (TIGR01509 family)
MQEQWDRRESPERNMSKIEAIVFDLGRVLVNVDITRGIFGLFGHLLANGTEAAIAQMMREPAYAAYNAGKLTPEQFYEAMKKKFSLEADFKEFARQWCDVFDPMDGMYELVKELRGKVRLGALSDTDPLHWDYIRQRFEIIALIEKPTLSFETGFRKPAKEAYWAAVRNVGVEASRCLYVDDLMENVRGAQNAGLEAVQFTGVNMLRREMADREIMINLKGEVNNER